ncbi:hypothetical protein AB833_22870 [Chromatiales bacterium (ex Bugula neritina AB1)]|nr:hypothetical protein AB833_22870 [Chromatiales bacterium (ex Bugula neritina AB1)]
MIYESRSNFCIPALTGSDSAQYESAKLIFYRCNPSARSVRSRRHRLSPWTALAFIERYRTLAARAGRWKPSSKSTPRSLAAPDIANTFFRCGQIWAWGRGTLRIIEEYVAVGLPMPVYRFELSGF